MDLPAGASWTSQLANCVARSTTSSVRILKPFNMFGRVEVMPVGQAAIGEAR
jgi:hypothetical protein